MVERGLAKYAVGQLERGSESQEGSISSTSYRWSVLDDYPYEDGYLRPFSLGADVRIGSPSQGLCD